MNPKCSRNFRKVSKKTPLVESFLYKKIWNFTESRTLPPLFLILLNFWKLITFGSCFWTAWDVCFWQTSSVITSSVIFYNVKLNVNNDIFAIILVRIHSLQNKHAREFLRGSYWDHWDHFRWFTQAESKTAFHSRLTAKIVYYKISCTRKTYLVGQVL